MTTLTSPHELLTAIPFLVGYQPENSLVIIGLKDDSVEVTIRSDFPELIDPEQIDGIAAQLVRQGSDSALLVAYLPDTVVNPLTIIAPIQEIFTLHGVPFREVITIKDARWRLWMCDDEECCSSGGNPIPELNDSRIAAEQVTQGRILPFATLADLEESLSALPEDDELCEAISEVDQIDYSRGDVKSFQREGARSIDQLVANFLRDGQCNDQQLVARALVRLLDLQVRDYAMGITTESNKQQMRDLWCWLMRKAPKGFVAPVAALHAALAYECGEGAIAQRSLDRAFTDDAEYSLAKLLRRVFTAGWPPESFAHMRAELHPKICASLFGSDVEE